MAIEEEDSGALEGLRDQLAAYVEVLDAAFTKKKIPERQQIWIQMSLFELYELLGTTLEALGETDRNLVELLQALTAEAQPGSDLHLYYSRRLIEEMEEADGEPSQHARDLCYRAYSIR